MDRKSILVFTPHSHPSHYDRDVPLVQALRKRGHRVTYAVPAADFTERPSPGTNFPRAVLSRPSFVGAETRPITSYREFRTLLRSHDILVMGMTKEGEFGKIARRLGKPFLQHQDLGGLDVANQEPDLFAVPGPWYKHQAARFHKLPQNRVIVTGSVQFDQAQAPMVWSQDRESFCRRYHLDSAKPIVVWLPEGPATHTPWYKERYRAICQTVQNTGKYNLIIKGHPWDYAGHKREKTYSDARPSWEHLAPGVPACQEEDAYRCFRHCDVGITVTSGVYIDLALFKKPALFVDFQEAVLPPDLAFTAGLPKKRFQGSGLNRLRILTEVREITARHANNRTLLSDPTYAGGDGLPYAGGECSLEELRDILLQERFRILDDRVYDAVVETYCYRNDGQSCERIAELLHQLPDKRKTTFAAYLSNTKKKIFEGGFDQLPKNDVEQVFNLPRTRPAGKSLRELLYLMRYSLHYWKQMFLSTFLMIVYSVLSSVSIVMFAPLVSLILNPNSLVKTAGAAPGATPRSPFSLNLNSLGDSVLSVARQHFGGASAQSLLALLCGSLVTLVALRSMCLFLGKWVAWKVQIKTFYHLERDIFEHVMRQPLRFFHRQRVGALISEIQTNVSAIVGPIQKTVSDLIGQPFLLGTYFVLMAKTSAPLTLITLTTVLLTGLASNRLGTYLRRIKRGQLSQTALVTALMQEAFYGIRVVKAFNAETFESERYARKTSEYLKLEDKHTAAKLAEEPSMQVLGVVSIAFILLVGAAFVFQGRMKFQGLLMFLFVAQQTMVPLGAIASTISSIFSVLGASERVFDILAEKPDITDGPETLAAFGQEIAFREASFDYGEGPVLRNITVSIRSGETVALVGPSGGGKSTFADLLLRFYDPSAGVIELDGKDIRRFTLPSYRRLFGVVPQEVILFNDTVRNNIAYGRPEATWDEVMEAARTANAHSFILSLPQGYDTYIGDRGVRLSGGERQRLAIARAVLFQPPILVFDEATSSLDNESERLVQEAIDRVVQNRTAILIAHRLSTIQRADRILVIHQGRIVEEGTHLTLLQKSGMYRTLYDTQFQPAGAEAESRS